MPKPRTIFVCSKCDAQFPRWLGRCAQCGAWGTVAAQTAAPPTGQKSAPAGTVISFADISDDPVTRIPTGLGEFDRVLGGGIAAGSVTLLGGEPGIGKSTLVLQVADRIALAAKTAVLYVAGEESASQIKDRINRLALTPANFHYLGASDAETIAATIRDRRPPLTIVDSIQTTRAASVNAEPGSLAQVKAATAQLVDAAKSSGAAVLLIGHITKDGGLAGPKTLEHLVDTVLTLDGEHHGTYRLLRPVKNRFGSTAELGVFEMRDTGLAEVANPSAMFLEGRATAQPGAVVTPVIIGARVFLTEIQTLVAWTRFGYPQRRSVGFEEKRLNLIATVLHQRVGVRLDRRDVHCKVAGGLRVSDPAADLAVALAIASAARDRALNAKTAVCGEVGLGGEIRPVARLEQRISEATKLGFTSIVVPKSGGPQLSSACLPVATIQDAIRELWGG